MIYDSDGLHDVQTISLASGAAVIKTITIDCVTGHSLSAEVVADCAVEARHGTGGAWTNIETTPISLTPYAGTTATFQYRITAGTITAPTTRAFRFRVGP